MDFIIPKRATIPYAVERDNYQSMFNANRIKVKVRQGESTRANENHLIGTYPYDIPPDQRGGAQEVKIRFSIDANHLLTVTTVIGRNDEHVEIIYPNSNNLEREEIAEHEA